MITFIIIVIIIAIILYSNSRNRREKIVKESLEETRTRTRSEMIGSIIGFIVTIGILIWGIKMANSSNFFTEIFGWLVIIVAIVSIIIAAISMFRHIGRADKFENMSENQYQKHQYQTAQDLQEETNVIEGFAAGAAAFGAGYVAGEVGFTTDDISDIAEIIDDLSDSKSDQQIQNAIRENQKLPQNTTFSYVSTESLGEVDNTTTFLRIRSIIVEKLGVNPSEVTYSASFANALGADSLDAVELIMDIEKEFGITIPDTDARNIRTVGDLVSYVKRHTNQ